MTTYNPNTVYDILQTLYERLGDSDLGETDLSDLNMWLNHHYKKPKRKEIIQELIEKSYIELESKDSDVISKIRVEKFRNEENVKPEFYRSDNADSQRKVAYEFAEYLVNDLGDFKPVLIDRSTNGSVVTTISYNSDNSIWNFGGFMDAKREARLQVSMEYYGSNFNNELKENLESMPKVELNDLGAPENYVAVDNGLLNIKEADTSNESPKNLEAFDKRDYITKKIPVEYDPSVEVPEIWLEFLEDQAPSQEAIDTLQEFFGYTLQHWSCQFERALLLLGRTNTGKSQVLEVLKELLGEDSYSSQSPEKLTKGRKWGLANLEGNFANIDSELQDDEIGSTKIMKKLISGEEVSAEEKGIQNYSIRPNAKHIYASNHAPTADRDGEAYYKRWITITFKNNIPEEEQVKDFYKVLTEGDNLKGILNWAIDGYQRLIDQNRFSMKQDALATKEVWSAYGNSVDQFINRCCILEKVASDELKESTEFKEYHETLYNLYEKYVDERYNLDKVSGKKFSQELKTKPGVVKTRVTLDSAKGRQRGFKGITLKDKAVKLAEDSS